MSRVGLIITVAVTLLTAAIFTRYPEFDLAISAMFFDPVSRIFPAKSDWFLASFRFVTSWLVAIAIAIPCIALIGKMLFPDRPSLMPGRAMLLILMTLALGPGLLVNVGLKENWNRPRPGAVKEFGGHMKFKPWWDPSGQCKNNCSFVSGESAAAFAMLAPAVLVAAPWQLTAIGAATLFALLMAMLRVVFGGHFFTDVVFAGALSAMLVWTLHGWLYRWMPDRWSDKKIEDALADSGRLMRSGVITLSERIAAAAGALAAGASAFFGRALGAVLRT